MEKNYYIGLDVGTNSIGWAVTDEEYRLQKARGKALWGVRLFEEAQNAVERRTNRTNRRRLARKKQRLFLLETLFAEELNKADPDFLIRMRESDLWAEDKSTGSNYSLFSGPTFTDKDYHRTYPTAYHLRRELVTSQEPHDVRLVYLALHHIMKSRGHFLYDTAESLDEVTADKKLEELCQYLEEEYADSLSFKDRAAYLACLKDGDMRISVKKKKLQSLLAKGTAQVPQGDDDEGGKLRVEISALSDMLAGASVSMEKLFLDKELKGTSINLQKDLEEQLVAVGDALGDRAELLMKLKETFDAARLFSLLKSDDGKEYKYLCEAKVGQYEQNGKDLRRLKQYVKKICPGKYYHIFSEKKKDLNNYAAYSRYDIKSGEYTCNQEDFCTFLKKEIGKPSEADEEMTRIYQQIEDKVFLPRLRSSDNGVIPYQLQKRELVKILDNASTYLPLLKQKDADGLTVADKVIKTFEFRVPYYVGPVNDQATHHWAVRFAGKEREKVYPWNFDKVIDTESSAAAFMDNLIGRCTYTGEKVLPKDSLLYGEFALLNELNPLRVDDQPLPIPVKKQLVEELFLASAKKVTKKKILKYLQCKGLAKGQSEITGIDDNIKTVLKSQADFRSILERTGDRQMVEDIIRAVLVFGEDKTMLRRWLNKNTHDLTDKDFQYICRLKYKDWGNLSETFLQKIEGVNKETGEVMTIMDALRNTNCNLMQLLAEPYDFGEKAAAYRDELLGNRQSLEERMEDMYISLAVRRSIRQTLRIVEEITQLQKGAPTKIFVEMARGSKPEDKGKRTDSRKEKLLALYRSCGEQASELYARLENEDGGHLRHDALYLYYTQLGKCMYSGEPIDLSAIDKNYDKDHIFPRSKIKDDSLDNLVLVKNVLNREKSNTYPIDADIRSRMASFWSMLLKKGFISPKKYERLVRSSGLTADELSAFVNRQLTQTQQSTKALTILLQEKFEGTRIVFSKAGNVSEFRQKFDLIKCRDINDLHHAKDAYLNIVVGNVYDTKFTKRFFAHSGWETKYNLKTIFEQDTPGAWRANDTIKTVKATMAKNNILVTRMPREKKGQLFKVTLQPASGASLLEKKVGLPTKRYGGYPEVAGTYFFVVEHTDMVRKKKMRVRTIKPVLLYKRTLYETNPIAYCEQVLDLKDPKVVVSKIFTDSLLELDGQRFWLSGRTKDSIILKHTYQLIDGDTRRKYERSIKNIKKYIDRCAAKGKNAELPVTVFDGIKPESNVELYDWLLAKSQENVYKGLLGWLTKVMIDRREIFCGGSLTTLAQSKILLEILKAFRCHGERSNLSLLCDGKKEDVGKLTKPAKLNGYQSAYLINQSTTGVYENKVNLLE